MFYKLINITNVTEKDGLIYLVDDDIYSVEITEDIRLEYFLALQEGIDREALLRVFRNDEGLCNKFLENLEENGFLRTYDSYLSYLEAEKIDNYNYKQYRYLEAKFEAPVLAYKKIVNSTVCILGVGGVGISIIENLVGCGVKKYILIDFDVVEKSNFNRQFIFKNEDIGKDKVLCTKEYISDRITNSEVMCLKQKVNTVKDLEKIISGNEVDMVINAADYPANIEDIVYYTCAKFHIPAISVGVGRDSGYWGPLKIGSVPRRNNSNELQNLTEQITAKPTDVSLGIINTIISSMAALDIALYLAGGEEDLIQCFNRRVYFNCLTRQIDEIVEE